METHAPPGSPEAGLDCLCSPLLNSRGAGLRQTPTDEPVAVEWFVDPGCTVHGEPWEAVAGYCRSCGGTHVPELAP